MLYIIAHRYFAIEHILAGLDGRKDIRIIYYQNIRLPRNRFKELLWLADSLAGTNLHRNDGFGDLLRDEIRSMKPNDRVLFFDIWYLIVFVKTVAILPTKNLSIWLWNPVLIFSRHQWRRRVLIALLKMKSKRVFTFDHADAARYGIRWNEQVYNPHCASPPVAAADDQTVDLFFVGADKRRLATLLSLRAEAEREGLTCYYHLVAGRKDGGYTPEELRHFSESTLTYEETLVRIGQARCLIEIVQPGQHGCTLRAMEALFFGKKLITDNPDVEREAFYRPENVYRLGCEKRSIRAFLDEPMVGVPDEVIDRHRIDRWIEKFLD